MRRHSRACRQKSQCAGKLRGLKSSVPPCKGGPALGRVRLSALRLAAAFRQGCRPAIPPRVAAAARLAQALWRRGCCLPRRPSCPDRGRPRWGRRGGSPKRALLVRIWRRPYGGAGAGCRAARPAGRGPSPPGSAWKNLKSGVSPRLLPPASRRFAATLRSPRADLRGGDSRRCAASLCLPRQGGICGEPWRLGFSRPASFGQVGCGCDGGQGCICVWETRHQRYCGAQW